MTSLIQQVASMQSRIDSYLPIAFPRLFSNRSFAKFCIQNKMLVLNGQCVLQPSQKIQIGDIISFDENQIILQSQCQSSELSQHQKQDSLQLEFVFENTNCAVINKPAGISMHPSVGDKTSYTIMHAIIDKYGIDGLANVRGANELGIVHRLDKDTSGLVLIAKNNQAHDFLVQQIVAKTCIRKYQAICHGVPVPISGTINSYLSPDPQDYRKYISSEKPSDNGKLAITNYKTLQILSNGAFSLVEFTLFTGRTHQIRIHSAHIKHPIVGDKVYHKNHRHEEYQNLSEEIIKHIRKIHKQQLHAYFLSFIDPTDNTTRIECTIDLPKNMSETIEILSVN